MKHEFRRCVSLKFCSTEQQKTNYGYVKNVFNMLSFAFVYTLLRDSNFFQDQRLIKNLSHLFVNIYILDDNYYHYLAIFDCY